jgi:hypothetical protein
MSLAHINWPFVGGVCLGKAVVFVLVIALTLILETKMSRGVRCIEAGLRGEGFCQICFCL